MLFPVVLAAATMRAQSQQPANPSRGTDARPSSGSSTQDKSSTGSRDTDHNKSGSMKSTGQLSKSDSEFVKKAARGGQMEVELAQQALSKASNPEVKSFAQRLIADHSKANDELKQIASGKGMMLDNGMHHSTGQSATDSATSSGQTAAQSGSDHSAMQNKLMNLSGDQFDKAYMKDMVADHQKDVAEFEKASKNASDMDIRSFAEKTLPTLREHLQMAQTISKNQAGKK